MIKNLKFILISLLFLLSACHSFTFKGNHYSPTDVPRDSATGEVIDGGGSGFIGSDGNVFDRPHDPYHPIVE
jgi:hypothetical protein